MKHLHRRLDKLPTPDNDHPEIEVSITGAMPEVVVRGEVVSEIPDAPPVETEADRLSAEKSDVSGG